MADSRAQENPSNYAVISLVTSCPVSSQGTSCAKTAANISDEWSTEVRKSLCTWFGEVGSCCCLPLLPQLAWNILTTTYKDFFSPLYSWKQIIAKFFSRYYTNIAVAEPKVADASWALKVTRAAHSGKDTSHLKFLNNQKLRKTPYCSTGKERHESGREGKILKRELKWTSRLDPLIWVHTNQCS